MYKKYLFQLILISILPFTLMAIENAPSDEERMHQELNFLLEKSKSIDTNIPKHLEAYRFKLTKKGLNKNTEQKDGSTEEDSVNLSLSSVQKEDPASQLQKAVEEMDQKQLLEFKSNDQIYKRTRSRGR
ncbi:MAG: hypothetical protein HN576_09245 [Bacteriovoracaceae bacterium]|jgi:hypothetical protein|nr:hypothetical protein [Bacteriovoracaceae bacterium]